MAEEQAIPEALLREAEALAREWADTELFHDAIPAFARVILAAELRGRTEQKEADARIAEEKLLAWDLPLASRLLATAIRQ